MKLDKYDGSTPLEVFYYKFDNCCEYNQWNSAEKLAHLKGALQGSAAQVLIGDKTLSYRLSSFTRRTTKVFWCRQTTQLNTDKR